MELYLNDCSIHGQFPNVASFREALVRIFRMRILAGEFERQIYCCKSSFNREVTRDKKTLPEILNEIDIDARQLLLSWFTKIGPYWDDSSLHGPDDYIECQGEVVTETAIGEAAFIKRTQAEAQLVSFYPSDWDAREISSSIHTDTGEVHTVSIQNHISLDSLRDELSARDRPLDSWRSMESRARVRFSNLSFADDCFNPISRIPFHPGAAEQVLRRLEVLSKLKEEFNEEGQRTSAGNELYDIHFTGEKAWFSDSSAGEKTDFRREMTFRNPGDCSRSLFATWHGKVKWPQIRIHFHWDFTAGSPIHVVYAGHKLTKR